MVKTSQCRWWWSILVSVGLLPACGTGEPSSTRTEVDGGAGESTGGAGQDVATSRGGDSSDGAAAAKLDLNAAPGTLGGRCETDADCRSEQLRCLAPAGFAHGTKYCAPTCSQPSDCTAFAQSSYAISVPLDPDGFGNNSWDSTLLTRGVGCGISPDLGGTQKYCQFFCVENAAASAKLDSCTCLPRYKRVTNDAGQLTRCDWDDASQCSPLSYPGRRNVCDACNSKPLIDGCHTGKYFCQFNRTFNGNCVDGALDIGTLESCVSATTSDCDPTCYEACANSGEQPGFATTDACLTLCCKPSNRPATQAPACTDPGSPTSSSGGSSSGGGSSAGASSGGSSSAGASSGGSSSAGASSGGSGGYSSSGGSGAAAGGGAGGSSSGGGTNPCVGKIKRANYCGSQLPGAQYSWLYTCENSKVVASQACDICSGSPPTCTFEQGAF